MSYIFKPQHTCSNKIRFKLDGEIIKNIEFTGGCNGNLKALQQLLDGMTVSEIEEHCLGISCGPRPTSCVDQLAIAVRLAYDEEQRELSASINSSESAEDDKPAEFGESLIM